MTDDIEELLRGRRPEPSADFVRGLEAELMARARRRRTPTIVQALGVAVALSVTVLVLGVTGALPLHVGGDQPATATQRCTTVVVERAQRRPEFVVTRSGDLRLTYRTQIVRRPVRRCR
jgi:hypothetical protein